MDFKTPFLNNREIEAEVEKFRKIFWGEYVPVDVERIIDLKLEMDIVPVPHFRNLCDTDALITSGWVMIYIDKNVYLDDRYRNRLRFSLAHELGHFVLHKGIYNNFKIKEITDFYIFFKQLSPKQYGYFETQANKFANYLLVPREILAVKKKKELRKVSELERVDRNTLNSYLSIPLSKIFGVSEKVIEIALNEINE